MRQNFVAQFLQLSKLWLWEMWLGITMAKNQALSVDQCQLQAFAVFNVSYPLTEHNSQI